MMSTTPSSIHAPGSFGRAVMGAGLIDILLVDGSALGAGLAGRSARNIGDRIRNRSMYVTQVGKCDKAERFRSRTSEDSHDFG